MTTLTREHLGILPALMEAERLMRQPRTLDELPEIRDQHREALARIPTPKAPEDRL